VDDPVVATRSLTKLYGRTVGVCDLDLELVTGEVYGFIGPNGAGKTTTIRLLLDLIRPTSGSATVFGLDSHRSAIDIRRRVGYVPARLAFHDRLTAEELFAWLGRLRPGYERAAALALAERLDLDVGRRIGELSTGNRQKVGLVQAFMHRPELLILDEPTSGLDPLVRREFRNLLVETRTEGATVLLSSHVLAEVEDMCDRVGTIVDGRLRSVNSVDELQLLSRRHVRVAFEGPIGPGELAVLPGVDNVHVVEEAAARPDRTTIELDVTGSLDRLIKELGHHTIVDFLSRSMSLEEIFLESYDGAERPTPSTNGDRVPRPEGVEST